MMDDTELQSLDDPEFDVFNDETFGNATEDWENTLFDSESSEEDLNYTHEPEPAALRDVSMLANHSRDDNFDAAESELEESISRLVFDDDEPDTSAPRSTHTKTMSYRTPGQVANNQSSSVVSSWLSSQESSVWSAQPEPIVAPPKTQPVHAAASQGPGPDSPLWDQAKGTPIRSHPPTPSDSSSRIKEKQRQMKMKTLEEIEAELLGKPQAKLEDATSSLRTHHHEGDKNTAQPGNSHAISSGTGAFVGPRRMIIQPTREQLYSRLNATAALNQGGLDGSGGQALAQNNALLGSPPRMQPGFMPPPNFGPPRHMGDFQQSPRPPPHLPPRMMPPGMHNVHPFPPRMGLNQPNAPPNFRGPHHRPPQFHAGPRHGWYGQYDPRQGHMPNDYWDDFRANGMLGQDVDIYSGLMTEKDKQRLKNIQIIQLQNDHPYSADYYFLMKKLSTMRIKEDERRDFVCFRKLYPAVGSEHNRNDYIPTHFENSLGKLQAVSALAPKKALDTGVVSTKNMGTWMSPSRSLLLTIERIYINILRVEEADFRATLRGKEEIFTIARQQNLQSAFRILNWIGVDAVAKYDKGKVLLARLLSVTAEDNADLYKYIIINMSEWFNGHDEVKQARVVYESVKKVVMMADAKDMMTMISLLPFSYTMRKLQRTRIGASYLFAMVHRIEQLFDELISADFSTLDEIRNKTNIGTTKLDITEIMFRQSVVQFIALLYYDTSTCVPLEIFPSSKHLALRVKDLLSLRPEVGKDGLVLMDSRYKYFISQGATVYQER